MAPTQLLAPILILIKNKVLLEDILAYEVFFKNLTNLLNSKLQQAFLLLVSVSLRAAKKTGVFCSDGKKVRNYDFS